jgi:hypothetical protein
LPPGGRVILDAGALFAWARGDDFVRAMIQQADERKALVVLPVVVIAQAIRGGRADAPIDRVMKQVSKFAPVTIPLARQAGILLGATGATDVVDALVAAEALASLPSLILTSDPRDIRQLIQNDPAHSRVQVVAV